VKKTKKEEEKVQEEEEMDMCRFCSIPVAERVVSCLVVLRSSI
jgi:hypothetical protein